MMTDQQIAAVAQEVLRARPTTADVKLVEVRSDLDFDGSPILRVTARYKQNPELKDGFVEAIHALRAALLGRGDDRFVFLTNESESGEQIEDDVD